MKISSTALQSFFNNIINTPGTATNIYSVDLYIFVTGSGRIVLNQTYTVSGSTITAVPPSSGTFVQDLGVREVNGDILTPVATSPINGQYNINQGTGVYTFYSGDTNPKMISFVYKVGAVYTLPPPVILQVCSADINVVAFGQTFTAGGLLNSGVPAIQRSKMSCKLGLEVSSEEIDIFATPSMQIGTKPILSYITQGLMDGASIYIQRGFSATPDYAGVTSMGPIIAFSGTVAEAKVGRSSAKLTVKARTELLDIQMPRLLFNPGCQNTLFDSLCTLNPSSYVVSGTVQAGSNTSVINTNLSAAGTIPSPTVAPNMFSSNFGYNNLTNPATTYYAVYTYYTKNGETLPSPSASLYVPAKEVLGVHAPSQPSGVLGWNLYVGYGPSYNLQNTSTSFTDWAEENTGLLVGGQLPPSISTAGYYNTGVITFTSGANNGFSRVVSSYTNAGGSNGIVTVIPPFPYTINTGDTFTILPGCDKSLSVCKSKFNTDNSLNYTGFPYCPLPETGA